MPMAMQPPPPGKPPGAAPSGNSGPGGPVLNIRQEGMFLDKPRLVIALDAVKTRKRNRR
jgi:hypothetical protein